MKKDYNYRMACDEEINEARKFIFQRYVEVGYINNNLKQLQIYTDKYIQDSIYFIACDKKNKIVGTVRVVSKNIPVLEEFELDGKFLKKIKKIGLDKVFEVGNLTAIPGKNIAKGLYKIVFQYACRKKYQYCLAAIDQNFFNKLKSKYFFINFQKIGLPKCYIGSISVPISLKFNFFFKGLNYLLL
ncbi:MAG: hypothetical protein ACD_26C00062G0004 [uncultured bacterium]|nr:MAG: hypothetical protein ACD_26C00062G0004 [uncultured bacterium]